MITMTFKYQLKNQEQCSNVRFFQGLVSNEDAIEILESIRDGYTFSDLVDEVDAVYDAYEAIRNEARKLVDVDALRDTYGTEDPFVVFDLDVDFEDNVYT